MYVMFCAGKYLPFALYVQVAAWVQARSRKKKKKKQQEKEQKQKSKEQNRQRSTDFKRLESISAVYLFLGLLVLLLALFRYAGTNLFTSNRKTANRVFRLRLYGLLSYPQNEN